MGNCDGREYGEQELPTSPRSEARSNMFFATQHPESNEHALLRNYKFISTYDDRFMGRASVL